MPSVLVLNVCKSRLWLQFLNNNVDLKIDTRNYLKQIGKG